MFYLNVDFAEGVFQSGCTTDLNGNQVEAYGSVSHDGNGRIFGDLGNYWLVGGMGEDDLWGSRGDDLMNADDGHTSVLQNLAGDTRANRHT